ncbi:MAG: universal stress protein [Streptosporangiaceae bacterium]
MRIVAKKRTVVVGVDGSPNSMAALRRGAAEAERREARLDVVQVVPASSGWTVLGNARHWLHLRSLVSAALPTAQHITTRLRIAHGEPAAALTKAARGAELLVVGAREHSEQGRPLGGSTVPAVISGSPCEVVVCADQTSPAPGG